MGTYAPHNMTGRHALIFGASGISGWAIVNGLLSGYPTKQSFSRITALTNRPLSPESSQWPQSDLLQVVSGLDLLTNKGQDGFEAEMKSKIRGIETVSHVFFFGEDKCSMDPPTLTWRQRTSSIPMPR
jgi:hypothetical protein